ncbi:MAG: hypothetical protein KKB59_17770, partial [Spirochaetes bacterium]|nr:hypothetical protein [Spirochaetota bacterium]
MNSTIRALAALAFSATVALATASAAPGPVPAAGVDDRALRSLAAEGTRLWECSSAFSRLGKAKPVATLDPGIALRRLAADLSAAGRYEEFRYLIEYVEKLVAAKRLEVLVVEGATPLPGFWPARRDGTRRAISIGAEVYARLSPDSSLYRSSFLRAAAALYYTDVSPALQGSVSGRNAASELSAFMSGLWVESLYLLEVVKLTGPEAAAPDYFDALLSSAASDDLRGAASSFFRVDLDFAYGAIRMARPGATRSETVEFLRGAARFSDDLAIRAASIVARPSPRPADLELGASARAALIALPCVVRSVLRGPFAKDAETIEAASGLVMSLAAVSRAYSALDPLVMAEARKRLNELRFSPPDPTFPLVRRAADYYDLPAAAIPPSLPGAASEAWFRLCLPSRPFEYSGELPLSPEEALRGSSFRFSYDEEGEFVSVEHFADGRLRASEELHWAARVRVGGDDTGPWCAWENAYGFPAYNELGFAVMRRRATVDGEVLRFYSPDGRGVPDRAG